MMTNKQTIDGVSRDAILWLLKHNPVLCLKSGLDTPELRALFDAEKVNSREMGLMQYVEAHPIKPAGHERAVSLAMSREMRVYIAGPTTGLPEFNFPAFNAIAEEMRVAGWHVENPAEHGHVEGAEWADYLRYDIGRLATCEAIMLLPGWSNSRGAWLEVSIAKDLGMVFMFAEDAEHEPAAQHQAEPVAYVDPRSLENFANLAHLGGLYAHEWMWAERKPGMVALYAEQPAPVAIEAAKAFAKGFNTLESGGGKYRINMQFQSREDAWGAFTALAHLKQLNIPQ